jgi:hypothetical protein
MHRDERCGRVRQTERTVIQPRPAPTPLRRSPGRRRGTLASTTTAVVLALGGCGSNSPRLTTTSAAQSTAPAATSTTAATTGPTTTALGGPTTTVAGQQPPGLGPERVPIPDGPPLGPVVTANYPAPIDGIQCQTSEQVVYHIHTHLTVFVNGQPRQVPHGIGIAPPIQLTNTPVGPFVSGGSCFYWLHSHAADGIMHIESPSQALYTLGQFFDVWGQPLAPGQVGPATGTVTAFVNGQPFTGNPRDIQLTAHGDIQLDIGLAVAPQSLDWSQLSL